MGLVNKVVPDDKLEAEVNAWCQEILKLSPSALSAVKLHFNADSERLMSMMDIGMHAVGLYQSGPEAQEGNPLLMSCSLPASHVFAVPRCHRVRTL